MIKQIFNSARFFSRVRPMETNGPFLPETIEKINSIMGGLDLYKGKKVITTSIALSLSEDNLDELRIIKKVPGCPNPSEDYFLFMFLRAYCKSVLNTGLTLRAEKDYLDDSWPEFAGHKDVERYFYYGEDTSKQIEDRETLPPKPMLVMTKKTIKEHILTVPFYRCKAFHHLVERTATLTKECETDPEFKEFERKYHVSIVEDPMVDMKDGLDYLLNKRKYESCLVEAGTTLTGPYLEDPKIETPFDLIVLSVFSGKIEKEWIGPRYPNLSKLKVKHDILYTSPKFPHKEGDLTVYVLGKKTK